MKIVLTNYLPFTSNEDATKFEANPMLHHMCLFSLALMVCIQLFPFSGYL